MTKVYVVGDTYQYDGGICIIKLFSSKEKAKDKLFDLRMSILDQDRKYKQKFGKDLYPDGGKSRALAYVIEEHELVS